MGEIRRNCFHGYVTICSTSAGEKDHGVFIFSCNAFEGSLEKYIEMMKYATR
jgi:hypothetical protein